MTRWQHGARVALAPCHQIGLPGVTWTFKPQRFCCPKTGLFLLLPFTSSKRQRSILRAFYSLLVGNCVAFTTWKS